MKSLEHSKKEEQSMMIMENRQRLDLTGMDYSFCT